jgi:hypothetical protein
VHVRLEVNVVIPPTKYRAVFSAAPAVNDPPTPRRPVVIQEAFETLAAALRTVHQRRPLLPRQVLEQECVGFTLALRANLARSNRQRAGEARAPHRALFVHFPILRVSHTLPTK